MLLRPIPFHTRSSVCNPNGVSQVWLTEKQVLELYRGVWTESTPLEDCQVLEVIALPVAHQGPVIDNLAQYGGFPSDYINDLRADPSIHGAFFSTDNGNRCVIYRIGPQNHEYWYCDTGVEDPNWLTDWLDYANKHNLYYYGCGSGANALFYYPRDTVNYRNKFSFSFRDLDLGYYEPSWEVAPDGSARQVTGCYHTVMQDSSQGELMQIARDSQGVSYHSIQRARPAVFADEDWPVEKMASLSNLLHRNDFANVLVCFHEDFLSSWQAERMEEALRDIATDMSSIVWCGATWYLIEVPDPVFIDLKLRSERPLSLEQVIEVVQGAHTNELLEKLTSRGKKTWRAAKEYVAVTDGAMASGVVEELNRPLNYQQLRKQKLSFGSVRIGIRTSDPDNDLAHFEKPLSPIPPTLPSTPLIETTLEQQNAEWIKRNLGGNSDNLEEFSRKIRPDLPPLKFIRPGQLDLGKMADELSAAYGAPRDNVQRMLDIWAQYVNQNPEFPPRQGGFDRARPASTIWNPDNVFDDQGPLDMYEIVAKAKRFQGRDVLVHRETGVKVYVIRRRYGMVTLQSEAGQEFVLNNDIVETVYDKESK